MQKIYYHKESDYTIVDLSGEKPIAEIRKEFKKRIKDDELEEMEIDEKKETFEVANGKLKKKIRADILTFETGIVK